MFGWITKRFSDKRYQERMKENLETLYKNTLDIRINNMTSEEHRVSWHKVVGNLAFGNRTGNWILATKNNEPFDNKYIDALDSDLIQLWDYAKDPIDFWHRKYDSRGWLEGMDPSTIEYIEDLINRLIVESNRIVLDYNNNLMKNINNIVQVRNV